MTTDQFIASDPAISAIVSASAGSGKTKVLTDRVLRLLLEKASPSQILCITYTKAAAAEMEERIESQLGRWAIAEDEALAGSLHALTGTQPDAAITAYARTLFARVVDAPVRIRIMTIHGFCQSVLARFPLEAGVPPHFTLIDEAASHALLRESRLRLFTAGGQDDPHIIAISALTAILSETGFDGLIQDIVTHRQKFLPWFEDEEAWRQLQVRIDGFFHVQANWTEDSLAEKHCRVEEEEKRLLACAALALRECEAKTDRALAEALHFWVRAETGACQAEDAAYLAAFLTSEGLPRKRLCTKAALACMEGLGELLLKEQERIAAFVAERQSLRLARMTRQMCALARRLLDIHQDLKARHGVLDYDDLIVKTVALFERSGMASWVLYKLDAGIDHLLLDEAQDTSPGQWKLVDILASEFFAGAGARSVKRTLFIVGDEKQSIYSFQGARPAAFDFMRQKLLRLAQTHRNERHQIVMKHVRLDRSFRSTAPVLAAVDSVFAQPAARAGLVFNEHDIRHSVHRTGAAGRVELWDLCEAPVEPELEAWQVADAPVSSPSGQQRCAARIADTIGQWLQDKRMLPSQGRPVSAGDILILVQRRGAFSDAMLRALKQRGIPVAGADRMILSEHIAVMDCMALGDFLLLPRDDLTLATVLKSPFIGISEEQLFELAYDRGEQSLWNRLRQDARFAAAYDYLSDLLAKTDYLSPFALFAYVLETKGGRRQLGERLGSEIEDPVNEFLSLALEYERLYPPSLQGFLHWLSSGSTQIKRDMEKSRDEVRIMTVHGAKGLQAPIVFLPDTARTPRYDTGIVWTDDERPLPLWSPFSDYDDSRYGALKAEWRKDIDEEYHRLLYVAMTRAEDELYICGWKGKNEVQEGAWYALIRQGLEASGLLGEAVDGKRAMESEQAAEVKPPPRRDRKNPVALPGWSRERAAYEAPAPRMESPSHIEPVANMLPALQDTYARQRGLLIHRLLQYLPDITPEKRGDAMERFIARYGSGLRDVEKAMIAREVLGILSDATFSHVFAPGSVAEVPISGVIHLMGREVAVSGRIDRLAVQENDVYIVDFKTNRTAPASEAQVPEPYLSQMRAYRRLVEDIYPGKKVHCALLWTCDPRLMVLSPELLYAKAA